jgi:very-short-patch-repair endonuclease
MWLLPLDDRSHNAQADRQRDALTKAGGYQTLRFQSKKKPSEAEIAALFRHARAWAADRAAWKIRALL